MTSAPPIKKVKRFRVKIGESYATLDFNLHEKGALVKTNSVIGACVFKRNVDCGHAMKRTRDLQKAVARGMFPNWDKLAGLRYDETPTVEEFEQADESDPSPKNDLQP